MAVTQSFTATAAGNTANGSVTIPSTMPSGSAGIIVFEQNNTDALTTVPAWLTELTPTISSSATNPLVSKVYGFTVGDGSGGTVVAGTSATFAMSATRAWSATLYGVDGVTGASPIVVLGGVSNITTTATIPTATTTETLWLAEVAVGKTNGTLVTAWTGPAGWTAQVTTASPTTFGPTTVILDRDNGVAGAGAYGGETYTPNQAINAAIRYLVGFRPAAVTLTYFYPSTDTGATTTGWTQVGATAFWDALSDANNGTYAESPTNPTGTSPLTIPIRPVAVPTDTSTIQVQVDLWSVSATTATAVVSLLQSGTVKKTWPTATLTSTPTTYRLPLTASDAASLVASGGYYSNLSVRIAATAA